MKTLITALVLLSPLLFSTTAVAQDCDRTCLTTHLNTYLDAVAAHTPDTGNLWVGFRQTENSVVIPEGQGVWASVTGLGSVQRHYLDPVQGATGYYGTVMMGEEEAVVAIRDFYVLDEESQTVMVSAVFIREAGDYRLRNHFTEVFHLDGLLPLPASYR